MYQVHTGIGTFPVFGTAFLLFLKGSSVHILVIPEYVLRAPDYFAGLQSPASLPAGYSCTSTCTDSNHTTKGLFTAACQHHCLQVHTWALALGCLGIQMWLVSFT
jgi:hypothetical protein